MTDVNGLVVIGYFCWWAINAVKLGRGAVQGLLDSLGIDFKLPEQPLRSVFLKAVREVQAENRKDLLIRKISKKSDCYQFGLVDENVTEGHLNYSHRATLRFSPETGSISCVDDSGLPTAHRVAELIVAKYNEYLDVLNSDDIRLVLAGVLRNAHVISVRERGGIYFLPASCEALVEKLEKFVAALGPDCEFQVAPQVNFERSKTSIYKAFISGLKEKVAKFEAELSEEGLTRKSTIEGRINEYKELRKEIAFYADALQFQAVDISASLDALTEKVRAKLLAC